MAKVKMIDDDPVAMKYLQTLRQRISERGLSESEFGRLAGYSASYISQLARGVSIPTVRVYNKLAELFGWPSYREQTATLTLGLEGAQSEASPATREQVSSAEQWRDMREVLVSMPLSQLADLEDYAVLKGISKSEVLVKAFEKFIAPISEKLRIVRELRNDE